MTEQSAVEAANEALYRAFETGDLDLMEAVWDRSDDVVCVHPGWPMLRGRERVLRSWALIMANTSYIQFFLTDVVCDLRGDVAVVTCTENILTAREQDPATEMQAGRVAATNLFMRRDGHWALSLHHGSPVAAEAPLTDSGDAE